MLCYYKMNKLWLLTLIPIIIITFVILYITNKNKNVSCMKEGTACSNPNNCCDKLNCYNNICIKNPIVNECPGNPPCSDNGKCSNTDYTCSCDQNWSGDDCSILKNFCTNQNWIDRQTNIEYVSKLKNPDICNLIGMTIYYVIEGKKYKAMVFDKMGTDTKGNYITGDYKPVPNSIIIRNYDKEPPFNVELLKGGTLLVLYPLTKD